MIHTLPIAHENALLGVRSKQMEIAPTGYDVAKATKAHIRMMKRREDVEHWLEGYRKAGHTL